MPTLLLPDDGSIIRRAPHRHIWASNNGVPRDPSNWRCISAGSRSGTRMQPTYHELATDSTAEYGNETRILTMTSAKDITSRRPVTGSQVPSAKSSPTRKSAIVVAVTALAVAASLPTAATATARTFTQETHSGSDPFSGSFSCDGFDAVYTGHDRYTFTNWLDASGAPVRQEGQIYATETDTNLSTGASVIVRTQLNVHIDFVDNIQRITGIRNLSTQPGRGVVIQSVGNRTSTADGQTLLALHGPADDINLGGGFCEALAG